MQDRQVEVVAGRHAAARVAGAVVLVAHRGPTRLTEDDPAARALVALAELVQEAAARQPTGPGALIAREATRWLMAQADRTSPGTSVDFGILSAAGPGRVAIFLHGAVTAVVAGERTEYYHGRDAVFAVDRATATPARAVGLFVDEGSGDAEEPARPRLPARRGIGRLVEGIAEADAMIMWSEPARAAGTALGERISRQVVEAADSRTAGRSVPAAAERRPADPDDIPTAVSAPLPDSVELSERGTIAGSEIDTGATGPVSPAGGRKPVPETDPHHAPTEISGRQRAHIPASEPAAGNGLDETADSPARGADPGRQPPVHPTPRVDLPLPPRTPLHGPPARGAPPLDAEMRRRTEATAKGTPLTVKVMGFKCARAHPTDPRAAFCSVCGMPVDQTQPLIEVVRPPLGILVLDDGATYLLDHDSVLGRDPEHSEQARRGLTPLQIADNSGGMSRAHAELLLVNWDVTLVDRGSTNGTRIRAPGYRDWVRVPPHQPVILVPGTDILIGNRMLRFESAAPPPFGS